MKKRPDTKRITMDAVLTAIALVIFIVELQFPEILPVPGVKLGLANVITLIAMFQLGPVDALAILLGRILLGGMFSGRIISILYSLAGGLLCYAVTLVLRKAVSKSQIWVCGVLGAIAHNAGQILTAVAITQTPELFGYFPILMVSGLLTGAFTGGIATFTVKKTQKLWELN
ncbi:MAG: Gx transporter family protein [Lachnospiraceae bacterium]|nr:Gx transporter family protein [Lachnospiraceae bacterium]